MDNKNNKSKSINMKLTNKKKLQKKITKVKTSNNLIRSQTNIKKQKIHAEIIKILFLKRFINIRIKILKKPKWIIFY